MKKPLLIVLAVAAAGAAGVWGYQIYSSNQARAEVAAQMEARKESLYCPECKTITVLPWSEVKQLPTQNGKVQCPKCKKYSVTVGERQPKGIVAP